MAEENAKGTVNEPTNNATGEQTPKTPTVDELLTELAKERADKERFKNSLDKTLKEKGEITKQLRAKQTAEEQLAEEQAEAKRLADEEMQSMRDELNRLKATNSYKNISDESTVDKLIEAIGNSDHNTIAEIIEKECKNAVRKAEAEWLKSRPQPASGTSASGITAQQIMAIKDTTERQKLIAEHMDLFK